MSKPTTPQAISYLILTIFVLYLLSSLFSFSFSMSEWNTFSKIIFWGTSIVLTVWTFNDYIINKGTGITRKNFEKKGNQEANRYDNMQFNAFKNIEGIKSTTFSGTKEEKIREFKNETSEDKGKIMDNEEKIILEISESDRFERKILRENKNENNQQADSRAETDAFILTVKLFKLVKENVNRLISVSFPNATNKGLAEMLIFNSSFLFLYLKLINPKRLELILPDYRTYLNHEMKNLGFKTEMPSYQKIIDKQIKHHTSKIMAFPRFPFDCTGSIFHNFYIKPFDNFHEEFNNISLIPHFYDTLRELITNLKNEIDQFINIDYVHTRSLTGYDAVLLEEIKKLASTATCHKEFISTPEKVFDLCQKAKKLFPINYVEEFENRTYEDYDGEHPCFEGKYSESRYFTALSYCCSIAINYLKTFNGCTEYDNPISDPFFKEFIKLLIEESREVDTEAMDWSLSTSFDDGFDYEEEIVIDFLFKVMYHIEYRHGSENELAKLAYNYYENPGTMRFSNDFESMLSETEKCQELNSLIEKVEEFILEYIFYCKKL